MTFKKKLPTRNKKASKLVLVRDIKSGHDILMPLSTIKNNPSRFKLITKEEQALNIIKENLYILSSTFLVVGGRISKKSLYDFFNCSI